MEANDILIAPDGTNDDEVNIYQANMWNNATLAALLRNAGVRSRSYSVTFTFLYKELKDNIFSYIYKLIS